MKTINVIRVRNTHTIIVCPQLNMIIFEGFVYIAQTQDIEA